MNAPLATRLRPRTPEEFIGQEALLGPKTPLRMVLEGRPAFSCLLWGPPGSGKTTVFGLLEARSSLPAVRLNATAFTVQQVREIAASTQGSLFGGQTLVFIDEVHRLNKTQQDSLLPLIEDGTFVLIGATTENPAYSLNRALLSRCRIFRLEPLKPEDLRTLLTRALEDKERGLGNLHLTATEEALSRLAALAQGDARVALNLLEEAANLVVGTKAPPIIDLPAVVQAAGTRTIPYDRVGDEHYNVISAFIKSLRGSDPDAALYYLARMLEGGEDPMFICRRMMILASEDIGNADPVALMLAESATSAFERIGLPEGRLILAQAATYLATAPKSNASYLGIDEALKAVRGEAGSLPVPPHLRGSFEPGVPPPPDYVYPHAFPGHFVKQQYLPDGLTEEEFYRPTDQGREKGIKERMEGWWGKKKE